MAVHEELRRLTRDDDDEAESAQETTASLREDLNSMLAQMQDVVRLRWLLAAGSLDHELNSPPPLEQNNSEERLVPDVAMDAVDEKARMARNGTNISASTPLHRCRTFPLWLITIAACLFGTRHLVDKRMVLTASHDNLHADIHRHDAGLDATGSHPNVESARGPTSPLPPPPAKLAVVSTAIAMRQQHNESVRSTAGSLLIVHTGRYM